MHCFARKLQGYSYARKLLVSYLITQSFTLICFVTKKIKQGFGYFYHPAFEIFFNEKSKKCNTKPTKLCVDRFSMILMNL